MKQETYYDLFGLSADAELVEITRTYARLSQHLTSGDSPMGPVQAKLRKKLIDRAYEVLSNPDRRAEYDAGLILGQHSPSSAAPPLYVEVGLEPNKASPIRRLLTIIAAVMVAGLVMQVSFMFVSYQRAKAFNEIANAPHDNDKIFLQDFYQTHGIRAASRAEAELLLADLRRKEQAARDEAQQKRIQEDNERKQRQFEEESRRIGAEVTANIEQAEREAAQQKDAELRQREERERAEKAAERARLDGEINRFRNRSYRYGE